MNPPLPLPLARSAWIRQEMASRVLTAVAACSVVVLALAPTVPAAPLPLVLIGYELVFFPRSAIVCAICCSAKTNV